MSPYNIIVKKIRASATVSEPMRIEVHSCGFARYAFKLAQSSPKKSDIESDPGVSQHANLQSNQKLY